MTRTTGNGYEIPGSHFVAVGGEPISATVWDASAEDRSQFSDDEWLGMMTETIEGYENSKDPEVAVATAGLVRTLGHQN